MTPNSAIGVFDSGVGGLPILQAIHRLMPHERLMYLADTGYAPYGDKSADEVRARALAIGRWFEQQGVKALVVACNTASVLASDALRAQFSWPVVAIEPAIKPAAMASQSGVVGVLATARTAASASVAKLVGAHGQHVRVLVQACPGLADAIEANAPEPVLSAMLRPWLQPMLDQGADQVVLGCTHYIVVRDLIQRLVGSQVQLLEPSLAVARQLQRRLVECGLLNPGQASVAPVFYSSAAQVATVAGVMSHVWGHPIAVQAGMQVGDAHTRP